MGSVKVWRLLMAPVHLFLGISHLLQQFLIAEMFLVLSMCFPSPLHLSEGCDLLHFSSTRKVPEEGNGSNVAALLTPEQSQPLLGSHCHPFLLLNVTSAVCVVPVSGT